MRDSLKKITGNINIKNCLSPVFLLFIVLFPFQSSRLFSQTTQVQFGQNRVQYHAFDWQYYNSDNFTIFFYPGGQEIGKFVWTTAEMRLKDLDKQMDFKFRSKVDILVYNDITDLAQTNIGLGRENYNIGGTTVLRDNKMFLHYDGNHRNLKRDLMKGLSELYIRQMMSGGSFGQKIQNAIFLVMPDWYKLGLSSYIGQPWSTDLDEKLKLYLKSSKKTDFNRLVNINPEFAGQSFWYMINQMYGREAIPNILYVTRINHSIEKGFVYSLGVSLDDLLRNWKEFYQSRYQLDSRERDSIAGFASVKIKKRNNNEIGDLKVSTDGKYAAYAAFDGGFYRIFVQDLKTKKTKQVSKGGFRSDQYPFDKSYPILTWTKTGHKLAIISEKKDVIRLRQIDLDKDTKTKNNIIKFQRIYGADFTNNPNMLIVSGQNKGQTDLYLYNTNNSTTTQLNNDKFDDLTPVYVNWKGNDGVLFSSNRTEDVLNQENADTIPNTNTLDLFLFDLNATDAELIRVTETPFANEKPIGTYSENYFSFLSDENGISNHYAGTLDTFYAGRDTVEYIINEDTDSSRVIRQEEDIYNWKGVTFPITDFSKGIEKAGVSRQSSFYFFGANKRKSYLYSKPNIQEEELANKTSDVLRPTSFRKFYKENTLTAQNFKKPGTANTNTATTIDMESGEITMDSLYNDNFRYTFESDFNSAISASGDQMVEKKDSAFNTQDTLAVITSSNNADNVAEEDEPPPFLQNTPVEVQNNTNVESTTGQKIRILPYRARFTSDYVVTQLDNSIMTQYYQSYAQNLGAYNFPSLSGMINFGVSDLMEDHKIVGGFRIPFDFRGFETFVKYTNLKKRIDKQVLYYRRSDRQDFLIQDQNGNTVPFIYTGKTRTNFFETAFSYPFDITKSLRWYVSYRNEKLDISYTDELSLLLEDVKENWVSGRVEFVQDNSKEIQFNIHNGFRYKVFTEYFYNANEKNSHLFNVGFDVRHYQKIFRNIIWANRFAGATSFGPKKILYILGGVDTWLNPDYAYNIPVSSDQDYGLQSPVTNLRGLPQNIRNGNNYLLWNSEFRFPVFSFFAKKPMKSAFLRDFQLVGFFDAGIAYNFANPFNQDNARSTEVVTPQPNNNPVVVTVNYYRSPLVYGTGAGFRTNVLGYFIRLDTGWGYNGIEFNSKPVWHFSLSKDF